MGKESACSAGDIGDVGSIPRSGGSSGGGNGNPLQYSCLENSLARGAWWATVYGVAKSQTRLSTYHYHKIASIIVCAPVFISLGYLPRSGIAGWDFSGGSDGKASAYNAGDPGSIPGSGRSPGEGNGNPLQYSCLENSMDREAWWATVHGVEIYAGCLDTFHGQLKRMC